MRVSGKVRGQARRLLIEESNITGRIPRGSSGVVYVSRHGSDKEIYNNFVVHDNPM